MKCANCQKDITVMHSINQGAFVCSSCFTAEVNKVRVKYHYLRAECLVACIEECCDQNTQEKIGAMYTSLTKES
jgi:hypothetical protein